MRVKYFSNISFRSFAATTSTISLALFTASYVRKLHCDRNTYKRNQLAPAAKMTVDKKIKTPFQTLFAVHMTCDHCVESVSKSLYSLEGIIKVDANLKDQLVTVEGTAAPSAIVSAIEATGRDAILRGSGTSNSAAVCILETYHESGEAGDVGVPPEVPESESGFWKQREVRGLVRMVQVSPETTLVDITMRGVDPGKYRATIREYGDLKEGAASTGPVWAGTHSTAQPRGLLGSVNIGKDGRGSVFLDHSFQVWEVIGHAMVVSKDEVSDGPLTNDESTVVGVIARSAGMWDNDKTVCSCTGKTLWEERKDEVKKGMI